MAKHRQQLERNLSLLFDDNKYVERFGDVGKTPSEQNRIRTSFATNSERENERSNDLASARGARKRVREGRGKSDKQKVRQLSRIVSSAYNKGNGEISDVDAVRINRAFKSSGLFNVGG